MKNASSSEISKPIKQLFSKSFRYDKVKGKDKKWNLQIAETAAYYYVDDVIIEKTKIEKTGISGSNQRNSLKKKRIH